MKLIITGANGFIARNIISKLDKKYEIILLTNKKLKFQYLKKYKNLRFDLSKNIIPKLSCDILLHAAAITPQEKHTKEKYNKINNVGLKNIINRIKIKKKIIFFSTSDVYKNQNGNISFKENFLIDTKKLDNYAKSKHNGEIYLKQLNKKKYSFKKIILRLPGIVGKGCHQNFISDIVKKIIKNEKIVFFGKNNNFNNIYHIDVLSKLINILINAKFNKNYEILNIGARKPLKIFQVIKCLKVKKENLELSKEKKHNFTLNVDKLNKYYKNNKTTKFFLRKFLNEKLRNI